MNKIIDTVIDYLFYNCYSLTGPYDELAKTSMACHMMVLISVILCCSIVNIATMIMPKKCVVIVAILLGIGVILGYSELEKRYENCDFTQAVIKQFSPTNKILSFFVVLCYVLLSIFPSLLLDIFLV